jgi:hypothetical protein
VKNLSNELSRGCRHTQISCERRPSLARAPRVNCTWLSSGALEL